jgi:hypothetical protein
MTDLMRPQVFRPKEKAGGLLRRPFLFGSDGRGQSPRWPSVGIFGRAEDPPSDPQRVPI